MTWLRVIRESFDRLRPIVHDPSFPASGDVSRGRLLLLYLVRGTIQVARESFWDRLSRQAAALAFQTIFSTVPLIVIGLTFLTTFISGQGVAEISEWLSVHMLPVQAQSIAPEVRRIAMAVDVHALGLAGGLGLVMVAGTLFISLSNIVDDIWRVRRKRAVPYRFAAAAVVLVLLPVLVGLSVYLNRLLGQLPLNVDFFIPLALNMIGLFFAYRHVPSTRVEPLPAIVAALFVGVLLELGKIGFGLYVSHLGMTIRGLYGAIGIIPLALFWIYLMWLFFLIGVETSFTLQNLPALWMRDTGKGRKGLRSTAGGSLALAVAIEVYRSGGRTPAELARKLEAAPAAVALVIRRLDDAGFVTTEKAGPVTPAGPADEIVVADVLDVFHEARAGEAASNGDDRLDQLLTRLRTSRREELGAMTLADLLS